MLARISIVAVILLGGMAMAPRNADAGELMRRIENRIQARVQAAGERMLQRAAQNPELQRKAAKALLDASERAAKDPVIQKQTMEALARIAENAANDPKTRQNAREALEGMLKRSLEKN